MSKFIAIKNPPRAEEIPELKTLLARKADTEFVALLEESLAKANQNALAEAPKGLDAALYKALPFPGMNGWPTTFDEYVDFLARFCVWIPQQSSDPAWLADPDKPLGEHQEVYDRLCFFYFLIDQRLDHGGVLQDIEWFSKFLVLYAKAWGAFLDTPRSFNDDILHSFMEYSPEYRVEDSMIGPEGNKRPNAASGWLTFNQFFARHLNPGLRPILNLADNTTLTVPADCTYKQKYAINARGAIPGIVLKGTHTYASVQQLLQGSQYADSFNSGNFIHLFLGPYSYHRFHTPVAGIVKECYALTGDVSLNVTLGGRQFQAADSATDGYEFLQARGVVTIDTTGSEFGDIGVVAVIPVGMCQVSGVNMTHEVGKPCAKGDEFGYFTFGGSDIIILTQNGADPQYNSAFDAATPPYSHYGSLLATVSPKQPQPEAVISQQEVI